MRLTVNQVEHILERWHRLRRGNHVHFGSSDPTCLTAEARRDAQQYVATDTTADIGITPRNILERIGDFQTPDPAIDYAEQRRAGQFLDPPYIPSASPPTIPKLQDRVRRLQELRERNAQRRHRIIQDLASRSTITLTTEVAAKSSGHPESTQLHSSQMANGLARPFQQQEQHVEGVASHSKP
jgi:hypothetical protein